MTSFQTIISSIYWGSILGLMVFGCLSVLRDPLVILEYRKREFRTLISIVFGLLFFSAACYLAALGTGGWEYPQFVSSLAITFCAMGGIALIIYPMAHRWEMKRERPPMRGMDVQIIVWLAMATILWSVLSMYLLGLVVDYELAKEGFINQVNPNRPLEFLGFCGFALIIAVIEETIFRGGLLGALEQTKLGTWGAVVVSAIVFALGHSDYINTFGIKELQIFGLGIIFGYARVRYGLTAAILLHLVNNGFALVSSAIGG